MCSHRWIMVETLSFIIFFQTSLSEQFDNLLIMPQETKKEQHNIHLQECHCTFPQSLPIQTDVFNSSDTSTAANVKIFVFIQSPLVLLNPLIHLLTKKLILINNRNKPAFSSIQTRTPRLVQHVERLKKTTRGRRTELGEESPDGFYSVWCFCR